MRAVGGAPFRGGGGGGEGGDFGAEGLEGAGAGGLERGDVGLDGLVVRGVGLPHAGPQADGLVHPRDRDAVLGRRRALLPRGAARVGVRRSGGATVWWAGVRARSIGSRDRVGVTAVQVKCSNITTLMVVKCSNIFRLSVRASDDMRTNGTSMTSPCGLLDHQLSNGQGEMHCTFGPPFANVNVTVEPGMSHPRS